MTTHLIGQLLEVKPIEMEDRKTGKMKYSTDLTIMFDGLDEEGYRKVSVETVNVDEEYYDKLKDKIGKTVAIAYTAKTDQWGTKFYADKSMPVLELDKNPFDYSQFKRTDTSKKS